MSIKFATIKWLPQGIIISGLSLLIYLTTSTLAKSALTTATKKEAYLTTLKIELIIGWLIICALTLGLQIYGDYRHTKMMAEKVKHNVQ